MLDEFESSFQSFENYNVMNDNLIYLDFINTNYVFREIVTSPDMAYRYQGNLYGLFKEMGVEKYLYTYTMYINGYNTPTDYKGDRIIFKKAIRPVIPIS